jgi:hypothetical protein
MLYGNLPRDIGLIDLSFDEMMFWMYCPIKRPNKVNWKLPDNLRQFDEIVDACYLNHEDVTDWSMSYVYLTAKTLYVSGDNIGNRPGWHSDGFGGSDINYIWCDRAPTDFLHVDPGVELSTDCDESMRQMAAIHRQPNDDAKVVNFPDKHLLRLDPSVIHRSPVGFEPGMRTFVKVSVSRNVYNLVGNSVNHALPLDVPMVPRAADRNHPHKAS